ncbi:MAG: DUF6636 domain-containing protein [Gaiellaceae bacterium]
MKRALVVVALVTGAACPAGHAAPLPGVRTPTRNISCFYVPIKPTARGNLLCNIKTSLYARAQQTRCQARAGLDWHGFELSSTGKAQPVCTCGVLYDIGRDTPTFTLLAYGRTWRSHGFTCRSRLNGLTCTNGHGHGLFLSREAFRLY